MSRRHDRELHVHGACRPGLETLERRQLLAVTTVQFEHVADIATVGSTLFFSASYQTEGGTPGTMGVELWKSNGATEGTVLVKDIRSGSNSSVPDELTNVNGTLFFTARTDSNGLELWKSDGTEAGTVMVKDITPGADSGAPDGLTNVNGLLFFHAQGPSGRDSVWRSDGTSAGTFILYELASAPNGEQIGPFTNMNGTAFFTVNMPGHRGVLFKSDGTVPGTQQVFDPGPSGDIDELLTTVGSTLFFTNFNQGTTGNELWKSDGTEFGTVLVKDINPGDASSSPGDLTNLNGVLFFTANNGTNGQELWKSDGTSAGTEIIEITPGAGSSSTSGLTNVNGTLFFRAENNLWHSNGTAAGTNRISSLVQPTFSPIADDEPNFVEANNLVFFPGRPVGAGPSVPTVLYRTSGTQVGTSGLLELTEDPGLMRNFAGDLYFAAQDNDFLFRTNGTDEGTSRVMGELTTEDTQGADQSPTPYFDSFSRPDDSRLAGPWIERTGDVEIVNGHLELVTNTETVFTLHGFSESNVRVSIDYDLTFAEAGQSVGVLARYSGPGDANTYMGRVIKHDGLYAAEIWVNLGGVYSPLAATQIANNAGNVRLNVVGNRLDLFINNVNLLSVTDNSIAGPGSAGIRQTGGISDNFLADTAAPPVVVNVALPFNDSFNRANNSQLGPSWTERTGDVRIVNGIVVNNTQTVAISTVNGPNVADVVLETDIDLTTLAGDGSSIGLLARYTGTGDSNGYLARLYRSAGLTYWVQIWRHTGADWEFLGQNQVTQGIGRLRFDVVGTSLRAFFNNALAVDLTDNTIAGPGLVGFRQSGGILDNYAARLP